MGGGVATLIRNDVQAEVINTTRETDVEKQSYTQCIHVWSDNGKKYTIHNTHNPPSCKPNVEQDLPTHFNTIYTGDFNRHSPLWKYSDQNATGHIQFNSIQFSLFPAHINISYNIDNVHIMCRKRGGQKTVLMNVHPPNIDCSKLLT